MCIIFLQITQKILTKEIFHWLELIAEILSFLQIFSVRKTTTHLLYYFRKSVRISTKSYISGIFWAFKSKLQIIHAATYVVLFLPDSNNCFFICLVPYIPVCLYYFVMLCFYLDHLLHSLLAKRHTLQFNMFDLISLQLARNISEIRNTSKSTSKQNCRVNHNQPNAIIFS